MSIDVTDATFETDVLVRSQTTPVVVDLWAPWCGPCRTLGPILDKVIDETKGKVVLAKVNVDENPGISQAFRVQSIPMVVAIVGGRPVNAFQGAQPEPAVRQFVESLLPTDDQEMVKKLVAAGDEGSLRAALELDPDNEDAIVGLADLLVDRGEATEALAVLARIPETERVRHAAARARVAFQPTDDYDAQLAALLPKVKTDDEARQRYVDILELMGAADPRTAEHRKRLTAQLY